MFASFDKLAEEKRQFIINISMEHFIKQGYLKANTIDIARECGIAKGSLFHYFSSKKDLFLYLVELCTKKVIEEAKAQFSQIKDANYFDRVRRGVAIKMTLPVKYPKEIALLTRAFSEHGHEASDGLQSLAAAYSAEMRSLSQYYIGEIEPGLLRENISTEDAQAFIQIVFDGITTRLLKQYAGNPSELLEHPEILNHELEKAINFILYGIGK